jgi:hypothetical protein
LDREPHRGDVVLRRDEARLNPVPRGHEVDDLHAEEKLVLPASGRVWADRVAGARVEKLVEQLHRRGDARRAAEVLATAHTRQDRERLVEY